MGNCFRNIFFKIQNSQSTANNTTYGSSKSNNKSGFSSQPSTVTSSSNPSSFTLPSSLNGSSLPIPLTEGEILSSSNVAVFTFNELKNATRNFRPDSLLGEGGFGYVYKGWIDEQTLLASKPGYGIAVAIKKLKPESFQGQKEWLAEVRYLGQLHHPNLVTLRGYCSDGDNRLLVYEFMSRGSLENHLFRRSSQVLSWSLRLKIAIGAAKGLEFLHNSKVIYRDLKASNILLDGEYEAKLSDFGLAKDGPTGDRTHISTNVMGTQGYAAPEYIATGRLTAKADVYSYGVLLLELITGRRAVDRSKVGIEQNLVEWAQPMLGNKRKIFRIIDIRFEGRYPKKGAFEFANLTLQCINSQPNLRPQMLEVLTKLEHILQV